jgi:pimeloyl-ACP methyl ester carboxylesterase
MPLAQTPNGPIWYADHRDPTAHLPVTLAVHGAGGTHLDWPAEIRRMPEANAVVVDLPGHGRSPGTGHTSIGAYTTDMIALLDTLKIPRAVIAGHSMGGAIAQTMAVSYPDRVLGLILIGTGAKLGVHPDLLNGILTEMARSVSMIVGSYYSQSASDQMRRLTQNSLMTVKPSVLYGDYSACNVFDIRSQLGRIKQPALIIGGSDDFMTPFKYSEYLHDNIAGSELVKVEGGAHMMMVEQPDFVAGAIQKWLVNQQSRNFRVTQ